MSPIGHRSSQTHVSIKNCLSRKRRNGQESRTRFHFPDHPDRVPQIASDAGNKCFHMSATWRISIGDRVPDRSQTVADHMETRLYCAPITETLFEGLSIWLRNKQVMLGALKTMCVNGIMYAGEFGYKVSYCLNVKDLKYCFHVCQRGFSI